MHVLLIKTSSMGDVIHTLPAINDAQQIFPNITFDWVVEENFAEIPLWHSAVQNTISVALRRWRKNWYAAFQQKEISNFVHKLRTTKYDFIIDAQGLYKSAIITQLARGKKCGYDFRSIREPFAVMFYQQRVYVKKHQHAITRIRQLFAQALGYKITNPNDIDYGIKNKFIATPTLYSSPYLIFIHSTSREEKCWQEEKWIELCKLAKNNNLTVLLPWGNETEQQRAERIANQAPNAKVLPKSTLTNIAELMTNSCGVVAVDTGLGHLAAALDIPTISLYGPTLPNLIGTWGKHTTHIMNLQNISAKEVYDQILTLTSS
jgi:heptosyltransferase I